jgi:TMEM175 potassium channel family protein
MADRPGEIELGTGRLEAFSDAVFAVIMTIMALTLKAPEGHAWADVRDDLLPGLIVYALSFTMVGIYWNNHHHLLRAAERINGAVMWANLLLLFCLSLVPVMTVWVREEYQHALPAVGYGLVAIVAAVAYSFLVRTLIRVNGRDSAVARAVGSDLKGYASLVMYAAGVALAFVSPWIAYVLYVAVAVMWFVPDRRFAR